MASKATGKARHPHNAERPIPAAVRRAIENEDIPSLLKALSVRQKRFAEEYVIDFNGAAAAVRAGYATTYSDRQAHILLRHEGVAKYIDHLTQSKRVKIMQVDPDYIIQEITSIIGKNDAKDSDKLRGLELLARHLGMFIDRQEITGKDGEAIQIHQQKVNEEVRSVNDMLRAIRDKQKEKA